MHCVSNLKVHVKTKLLYFMEFTSCDNCTMSAVALMKRILLFIFIILFDIQSRVYFLAYNGTSVLWIIRVNNFRFFTNILKTI